MKKSLCLLLTLLMLFTAFGGLTASAATGSLSAAASASSVTVGSTVTVTLTYSGGDANIASLDATVQYNAAAFEYVSCTGDATANGGAGVLKLSYYATGAVGPKSVSVRLTFKAIAAGAANFAVSTSEFMNDADYTSLGAPAKTLAVSAINPTKSSNANLTNIKPSSGTLTPAFKPDVTNYTISVPYTTTSLSLSATTQDAGATVAVSGKNALVVGKNTQVITVTAANGTTKQYTVVINRSANQTTTQKPTASTTTGSTQPKPDPLEVAVNGVLMTVSDTQPNVTLPKDFKWTSVTINNVAVSAAFNETLNMTLVYLNNALDQTSAFYIFDEQAQLFHPFCSLAVPGGNFILLDMPNDRQAPAGTVVGTKTFDGIERRVFLYEDTALADIAVVYATTAAGKSALYTYDATDGSMQLYREIAVNADAPTATIPAQTQENGFVGFVTQNRAVILICAAALGGLALLIGAVVLLMMCLNRDKGGKH